MSTPSKTTPRGDVAPRSAAHGGGGTSGNLAPDRVWLATPPAAQAGVDELVRAETPLAGPTSRAGDRNETSNRLFSDKRPFAVLARAASSAEKNMTASEEAAKLTALLGSIYLTAAETFSRAD
jgi:hypothetical protein